MKPEFQKIYTKLESLSRDELYGILLKAGVEFPTTKMQDITKEELLLVADEADMDILLTITQLPSNKAR
jgi:hypothetical protein